MLTLYHAGGAGDFYLMGNPLDEKELEILLFNTSQMLLARGHTQAAAMLTTLKFELSEGSNDFNDEFCVLHTKVPLTQYEYLRERFEDSETRKEYREIFSTIAGAMTEIGHYIRFIACYLDLAQPSDDWRTDLNNAVSVFTSNQALFTFRNSAKIIHDGVNFRSKTEIRIFDTLVKRGVLVFPLPLAVMGQTGRKLEPDFVVCHNGKAGILEIHGDKWHTPETAAKEHERRRDFLSLGINIFEIFDAQQCWNEPEKVVDEFLKLFL